VNWNWEFRSCRRIVVEGRESREWGYLGVQHRMRESNRKLVVEEELEVSL
jgi:hypothetical protein